MLNRRKCYFGTKEVYVQLNYLCVLLLFFSYLNDTKSLNFLKISISSNTFDLNYYRLHVKKMYVLIQDSLFKSLSLKNLQKQRVFFLIISIKLVIFCCNTNRILNECKESSYMIKIIKIKIVMKQFSEYTV